ncbi:hypothetical protein [Alcaligenes faecalis]|uniref:hypothetical protein n=1 Tax=Alcaligenes faecalis TaxID=511 RepID=UPI0005A95AEB|nr:hypothetical protein [Alcaligenes faecalis]ATI00001.1 hypothetical protein CPY64_09775 [Alcaligenes faecalis]AYZ92787.1 hypothetical protein EGY22_15545 [Alcaligenes faecalis]MCX5593557.1 hypothetical protein [Alcaligenes faecalis]QQC31406.1 hypothetical protein I6H81_12145 [Alcaligenes faecalis]CAJ0905667.1 DUF2283 domain-containing protein [Alcaligenes faecalis subsp. faecalis]
MKLQLATLSINELDEETFFVNARVEIVVPQEISAAGFIELSLDLDRETLGKMTFNEISDLAEQQALAAVAASK